MKVLHFYKTFSPDIFGGIEKTIDQISISTQSLGIESTVLSLTPERHISSHEMNGYQVQYSPQICEIASTPFSIKIFKLFSQLSAKADIIHYHFPWPFADVVHFATRVKKPTLVTYHSDIIKQKNWLKLYTPLMNRFLAHMNAIVATSPNYMATSPTLSHFSDKVSVIPYGLIRESYLQPSAEKLAYFRHMFKGRFFLFIGVFRYYKGLHFLIEAAKGLDASILIIGSGASEECELKKQITRLGISNVHFLGAVSEEDKVALLTLCYSVVLSSHLRSEAFGISLLEGAMFGKPLISCEIGTGTTYINIHKETGIVVPPANPLALREAMQFLLDHPNEAAKMGIQAESRYWTHFTAEKMAKSYATIYENLMQM